jgi:DNA-binding Lrp family transcriptional regulator
MGSTSSILTRIHTPFDSMIPEVEEPSAKFYIDAMRIYLALSSRTISFEEGIQAVEDLKKNPEYVRSPTNPTQMPINEFYKNKILENLKTLKKFNLVNRDSVRSAYSFVFISQSVPIQELDFNTLQHLVEYPRNSITHIAKTLGIAPRTVTRSLDRLRNRHLLRPHAYLDNTPWGVNTVMLFFTHREDVDWGEIEEKLLFFPYVKTILKTTMTDLGYVSFIVPGYRENNRVLANSIKSLSASLFDYVSIHEENAVSASRNLSLFKDGQWRFPESAKLLLEDESIPISNRNHDVLSCNGFKKGITPIDYRIGLVGKSASRATPSSLVSVLANQGIQVDTKRVTMTLRKLYEKGLMMPYMVFDLGLNSDFCFEIVCNSEWRDRIADILPLLPYTMSFMSPRGIVVWASVPGYQQVEYYQMFRALEEHSGVKSVRSIMTIVMKGSRLISDLVESWNYTKNGYTVPKEEFNLVSFLSDFI